MIAEIKKIVPQGVDLAVESSGVPAVMEQAISSTRQQGGRAVVIGNAKHGAILSLNPGVFNQGKSLLGTWGGDSVPDRDYGRYRAPARLGPLSGARSLVEALSPRAGRPGAAGFGRGSGRAAADRHVAALNQGTPCGSASTSTIRSHVMTACFMQPRWNAGLIPPDLARDKNSVRDHLNGGGRKDDFTELQGYVYGARMDLVSPFPGFAEFIGVARGAATSSSSSATRPGIRSWGPSTTCMRPRAASSWTAG